MDLIRLVSIRFTCVLVFKLCVLTPMINGQIQGCTIEGIDLSQCLNQGNSSSLDICCKTLNQVVQVGYSCLCSLVASSIPVLSTPLSLSFSNCDISVPTPTLCRVVTPMPVVLPPASPKELVKQPSAPSENAVVAPPPNEMLVPLNTTKDDIDNCTTVAMRPPLTENSVPKISVSKDGNESSSIGKDGTKILLHRSLLLFLSLYCCILLY